MNWITVNLNLPESMDPAAESGKNCQSILPSEPGPKNTNETLDRNHRSTSFFPTCVSGCRGYCPVDGYAIIGGIFMKIVIFSKQSPKSRTWSKGPGSGYWITMLGFLDKIPYSILIIAAIFMLLAPFRPMPHVVEKLIMLKNGTLTKPIDVFDLFYHLIPVFLLILKRLRASKNRL